MGAAWGWCPRREGRGAGAGGVCLWEAAGCSWCLLAGSGWRRQSLWAEEGGERRTGRSVVWLSPKSLPSTLLPPLGPLPSPQTTHPGLKATFCRLGVPWRLEIPLLLPQCPLRPPRQDWAEARMGSPCVSRAGLPEPCYLTELWGAPSFWNLESPRRCFHPGT